MLQSSNKKVRTATFLEKVATFDFDRYYTPKVRFICHAGMWGAFSLFVLFNLYSSYGYGLNFIGSLLFTLRSLICNLSAFYLFFYFFIPNTLFKGKILLMILSFFLCIVIWLVLNHYCMVAIESIAGAKNSTIHKLASPGAYQSIANVFSINYILSETILVLYSISPYFFIKTTFEVIRFYSKSYKNQQRSSQLEIEKLSIESNFLKSQLNPHFLFNTLNNLYGLVLKKSEVAPHIIMQLSAIMRYTLYESDSEKVPLSKELDFIRNYISLEKLRYSDDKKIVLNIDEANTAGKKIVPLLTFIFIENGFKYGLKLQENSFLEIKIALVNKKFYFSITNDKDALVSIIKNDKEIGGIGLKNVRKRLDLFYPNKHQLIIYDEPSSYNVQLQIELE